MKSKISVIVPIYNVEEYLHGCLDSIVNQTMCDIEIILVDDCGRDNSMDIARGFAARDERIKIITHAKNGGRSAARNTGLENSTAPLIMFCDSDDKFAPDMCQKMCDAITESGADSACCGIDVEYENGTTPDAKKSDIDYYKVRFLGLHELTDQLKQKIDMSVCNKIFRREIIQEYKIKFPDGLNYEDAYFVNAYLFASKNMFFMSDKLYFYLRHGGSIMVDTFNGKSGISIDHLKIAIALCDFIECNGLFNKNKDYMVRTFFDYLCFALSYEPLPRGKSDIYKLANDFVRRKKWNASMFAPDLHRKFQMLANRTMLGEVRKLMFGIVKIKDVPDKKKIYFLKIPVWKIKYRETKTKYYLLGFIPIAFKKTSNTPKISVLMPTYNAEKYIKEAIDSILAQTFKDFEFIIVNDGSTDNTAKIVKDYTDPRIGFIDNPENQGLVAVLNQGLDLCRGKYVARMDSDDISHPTRFEAQVNFMDKNKKVGVLGTWFHIFGGGIDRIEEKPICANLADMVQTSPVGHPTAMFRKSVFNKYGLRYDPKYKHAEDYELWQRVIKYTRIGNLQEVLLDYRWSGDNISARHEKEQLFVSEVIKAKIEKKIGKIRLVKPKFDDSVLLSELREMQTFTYMPNSGNMGDALIASATMQWFDANNLDWKRATENNFPKQFVYGGGGAWIAEWINDLSPLMGIMKRADKIIILPSSFNNVPEFIKILDERFVVFCREKKSFDYLCSAKTGAKIILDNDMALRQNHIPDIALNVSPELKNKTKELDKRVAALPANVRLFRTDSESAGKYATDLDLSDSLGWFGPYESRDNLDFAARVMICTVAKFDRVETDRLHVAIASAMTGADVYLYDNSYGKLSGVYNQSLSAFPNINKGN